MCIFPGWCLRVIQVTLHYWNRADLLEFDASSKPLLQPRPMNLAGLPFLLKTFKRSRPFGLAGVGFCPVDNPLDVLVRCSGVISFMSEAEQISLCARLLIIDTNNGRVVSTCRSGLKSAEGNAQ